MNSNVVVGYDGSPESRAALDYAAGRVNGSGTIFIVSAADKAPDYLGEPHYQQFVDAAQTRSRELLEEAAAQLPEGVDYVTEMLEGPAADAIVRVAEVRDADEIIVGSRGLGRVRAVLGSVSHDVLHLAHRPVIVIEIAKEGRATTLEGPAPPRRDVA